MLTKKCTRFLMLVVTALMVVATLYLIRLPLQLPEEVKSRLLWKSDWLESEIHTPQSKLKSCRYPDTNPWDKTMMSFFKDLPPLKCEVDMKNWIEVIDGRFVIMPHATAKNGNIQCKYSPFKRRSDHTTEEDPEVPIANNSLIVSDFFKVNCKSSSGSSYSNIHAGIHRDENLLKKESSTPRGLGLDVLIIGFDSVSRMTFMRKMPKTYKFLTKVLGAIVLKGYNIVGDGTPQALIPIFTGRTELELPRPLKRLNNGLYADVFPLAWKNFSQMGYVTAWSEDLPSIGTFTYRMTGFNEQPTDHYMRTFHLKVDSDKHKRLCIGDRPRARVALNWMIDFMKAYRNNSKFGFMFHSELSHGSNDLLQTADDDLTDVLSQLAREGLLKKTLLIVMSDHGARFSSLRATMQGKQEERNPFFSFTFPDWFKSKRPTAIENFRKNSERLTTPFDLHPTLLDILDFKGAGLGDKRQRGISLFKEIPLNRTCADADIEPHWCNCLQWTFMPSTDARAKTAAKELVKYINDLTHDKRDLCVELALVNITHSAVFKADAAMLAFKKTIDADGFAADLSSKTHSVTELIQITIITSPNNGLYESTIVHDVDGNVYTVKPDEISRINKYGDDPHCIYDTDEQLRKYCFCKDRLAKS